MAKGRAKTVCASCLFVSHNTTQDGKGCNVRQSGIACRHRWGWLGAGQSTAAVRTDIAHR